MVIKLKKSTTGHPELPCITLKQQKILIQGMANSVEQNTAPSICAKLLNSKTFAEIWHSKKYVE